MTDDNTTVLRARDFWGGLVLMAVSALFLIKTTDIPLFGANRAGVSGSDWYNSAALVPYGIFGGLLVLSIVLLTISVRAGGARAALNAVGLGWDRDEALRFATLAVILLAYVVALVPRVDFILCSGLLITVLIHGYHGGTARRMMASACLMGFAGVYALIQHLPQSEWRAQDDDWLVLFLWATLSLWLWRFHHADRARRITPVIALVTPLVLVTAMAFGFRQNVPNRGGLIFGQIEYHYYVTLKPLWSR